MKSFFGKILANIKHIRSTAIGALVVASAIIQSPAVQSLAQLSPKIANGISIAGGVTAGGLLILGCGDKTLGK